MFISTLRRTLELHFWNKTTMSSLSVDMSRLAVSAEECGEVLLRILTDDSGWTARTSCDDAFGEPIMYGKWSIKRGQVSTIAEAGPGPLLSGF